MKRKRKLWCAAICLLLSCNSIPSVTAKADIYDYDYDDYNDYNSYDDYDGYDDINQNIDNSDFNNDSSDRNDSDIPAPPDLSLVTISPASQTGYAQKSDDPWLGTSMPEYHFTLNSTTLLNEYDDAIHFSCASSNPNISVDASLYDNIISITPSKQGKTTVTITINEKTFQVSIHTVLVNLPNSMLMTPKQSKSLSVNTKGSTAKWSSSNPAVASISSNGKITARKTGNAIIKFQSGDCLIGCVVSVVTPARKRAVQNAVKIAQTCKYSQPKRMQEKFYDCSSLVWKSYHKNGVNFGAKNYAPIAADIGKWCTQHKKLIKGGLSQKNVQNLKLNPGDLMFETGAKNGRYKGIYHVEMITGYVFWGFDETGKAMVGLQWATGTEKYYPAGQMVGRP